MQRYKFGSAVHGAALLAISRFIAPEKLQCGRRINLFLLESDISRGNQDPSLLNLDLGINILELVASRICMLKSILQLAKVGPVLAAPVDCDVAQLARNPMPRERVE